MLELADRAAWWLRNNVRVAAGAVLALAAVVVLVLVLRGGGDSGKVPSSAIAVVGDSSVSKTDYAHWQAIYRKTATGTTKPTDAQVAKAAFQFLVGSRWIEQEAQRQSVKVSDATVNKAAQQLFAQSKGLTKAQVLAQAGETEDDVRYQQRISLLARSLQNKAAGKAPPVTTADIQNSYNTEPERWAHPQKRDLRVVLTSTEAQAIAAAAALKAGQSFSAVSKQYSVDTSLSQAGGVLKGMTPGTSEAGFERAVFKAQPHVLTGPVKTATGWIVFQVQRTIPLADQSLAAASAAIRKDLQSANQTKAVDRFLSDFQKHWRPLTHCDESVKPDQYCAA